MGVLDTITDAASKIGKKMATAPSSEAAGIKATSDNINSYMNAVAKKPEPARATPVSVNADRINPKAKFGDRPGEMRPGPDGLPQYHKGTTNVKKTEAAKVKKGEAIIPAHENPMNPDNKMYDLVTGKAAPKPKKEIDHIKIRKAKTGGHVVEHHHTHPSDHPMEEHLIPSMDKMHDHLEEHMGAPNDGEESAESGAQAQAEAVGE